VPPRSRRPGRRGQRRKARAGRNVPIHVLGRAKRRTPTFLSDHAHVLPAIAAAPATRMRDVASRVPAIEPLRTHRPTAAGIGTFGPPARPTRLDTLTA